VKKTIVLRQGSIAYSEDGEGPPVVLLHGLLVNGSLWRKVVPKLSGEARVIVPELPLGSHETPMRPDADLSVDGVANLVADFLEALELEDVTLVGVDTGGALTQIVATERPERVGRIVLSSCDAFDTFPPAAFKGLILAARIPGALVAMQSLFRIRPLWHSPLGFGWLAKRRDEQVIAGWLAPGANPEIRRDAKKVLSTVDPAITRRAGEKLRSFDKPALIAWAADDRVFPVKLAHRLADTIPNARVDLVPDSYTFTPEDNPDDLAAKIRAFVRETRTTEATTG
jgi:pimeloyl-ACP methyl ester carboxylesterase